MCVIKRSRNLYLKNYFQWSSQDKLLIILRTSQGIQPAYGKSTKFSYWMYRMRSDHRHVEEADHSPSFPIKECRLKLALVREGNRDRNAFFV